MPTDNPISTEVVFEDAHVRVWRIVLKPGEEAPCYTHALDYTSVSIEGDLIERLNADGPVDRITVRSGPSRAGTIAPSGTCCAMSAPPASPT